MHSDISVFLSYTTEDKKTARRIASDLHNRDISVWWDEWSINVGQSIVERITKGLSEVRYLLILLSEASVRSQWVSRELNSSLVRFVSTNSLTIIPARLDNATIPHLIADIKYADFRNDYHIGLHSILGAILPEKDVRRLSPLEESELLKLSKHPLEWYNDCEFHGIYGYDDTSAPEGSETRRRSNAMKHLISLGFAKFREPESSPPDVFYIKMGIEITEEGRKWLPIIHQKRVIE